MSDNHIAPYARPLTTPRPQSVTSAPRLHISNIIPAMHLPSSLKPAAVAPSAPAFSNSIATLHPRIPPAAPHYAPPPVLPSPPRLGSLASHHQISFAPPPALKSDNQVKRFVARKDTTFPAANALNLTQLSLELAELGKGDYPATFPQQALLVYMAKRQGNNDTNLPQPAKKGRLKQQSSESANSAESAGSATAPQKAESRPEFVLRMMQNPGLRLQDISACSGVSEQDLRYRPEYKILSPKGEAVSKSLEPQGKDESGAAFARRVITANSDLSEDDLAVITQLDIRQLRKLGMTKMLTIAAAKAMNQRRKGADETPLEYARIMHILFPTLTISELSAVSEMDENDLWQRPEFKTLSPLGEEAIARLPRDEGELPLAWAIRIWTQFRLPYADLCYIAGMTESNMRGRSEFKEHSDVVEAALAITPRRDNERNTVFAVRLKAAHPHLNFHELSAASGASLQALHQVPALIPLTKDAEAARLETPRGKEIGEEGVDWAIRLHKKYKHLTIRELSSITLVYPSTLRRTGELRSIIDSKQAKSGPRRKPRPLNT